MKIEEQTGCSSSADAEREPWELCSEWEELGMTVFYLAERLCYRVAFLQRHLQSTPLGGCRLLAGQERASRARFVGDCEKKATARCLPGKKPVVAITVARSAVPDVSDFLSPLAA